MWFSVVYSFLYNNQINARALIGQSAVVYTAVVYKFFSCSTNIPRGLSDYKP